MPRRPTSTIGNPAALQSLAGRAGRVARAAASAPLLRARGYRFGRRFGPPTMDAPPGAGAEPEGRLAAWAEAHSTGRGLWKWSHYFNIYERHLGRFVGTDVSLLEIGVYSGGSLDMWREYLGPRALIHGVDIAGECRAYARDGVRITIGDQADPAFWRRLIDSGERFDVVVDDGGHELEQQVATLEALLPQLRPGGVYICEDIAGVHNPLHDYLAGLTRNLDAWQAPDRLQSRTVPTGFQRLVASIHRYPYLLVIERTGEPPEEFSCPRHGTEWQPF